jgi:hypothetical protein
MITKITIGRDKNGNRVVWIKPATWRRFVIQTLGNLPTTHRDGVNDKTLAKVAAYVTAYGTAKQRSALDLPPMPRYFIQRKGGGYLETVDEYATRREAREMLAEYRMADTSGVYYISTRPCKAWKERGQS